MVAAEETMLRALVNPSLPEGQIFSYVVNKTEIMTSLGFQHIDDM